MTHKEMLKRMGLTEEEFRDLLTKFRHFYDLLNANQKAVVTRSLPTLEAAARSFGPDVSVEDMQELLGADAAGGVFGSNVLGQQTNGDDDNGNGS